MSTREYQKYEFCKSIVCPWLLPGLGNCEHLYPEDCFCTAKEFHSWLQRNGFKIVKEVTDERPVPSHQWVDCTEIMEDED